MRHAVWAVVVIVAAVLLITVPGCQSGSKPVIAEAVLQVTPPLLSESMTVVNRVRFEDQVQQSLTTAQLQGVVDTFHLYEGSDRVEQLRMDLSILVKDHQVIVRYRHRKSDRAVQVLSQIASLLIDNFQTITSQRIKTSRDLLDVVVRDRRRELEAKLTADRTVRTPAERDRATVEVEAAKENYKAALFDVARVETTVAAEVRQLGEQVRLVRDIHVVSQ